MKRFRLSEDASQDVREIWTYIARDNLGVAGRVRQEIRDACLLRGRSKPEGCPLLAILTPSL